MYISNLEDCVRDAVQVDLTIDVDQIIQYISRNYVPEGIFSDEELASWADDNGYVRA